MGWQDRFTSWVDHQIERFPALDAWLERHFHAMGIHGPYARHLAKTRLAPAIAIGLAMLLALVVVLLVRRSRARRRAASGPAAGARTLSAAGGRPPSP
jgi:hypothetical protein